MGKPPVTVVIQDLDALGLGDVWHVDLKGEARRVAGFVHTVGQKLVDTLHEIALEQGGGYLIYDPQYSPYTLTLVLH